MQTNTDLKITLIGTGVIGLSFAAFHLEHLKDPSQLTIYDTRPDLKTHLENTLPKFSKDETTPLSTKGIQIATSLEEAVTGAHIIEESGPENLSIKQELWAEVEKHAPKDALLWSSTSGIPASQQAQSMQDKSRLLVVHPYNPPHIMPLLELVPSPQTASSVINRTQEFWRARGRVPIHIKQEKTGFVANRLALALFREAVHLVDSGVVSVLELDQIVEASMGPRWAVAGPFKSYHAGGGQAGIEGLFKNIGDTMQGCWNDAGKVNMGDGWEEEVYRQTKETYGVIDVKERDRITRRLLEVLEEEKVISKESNH